MTNKLRRLGVSVLNSTASFVIFWALVTWVAFAATLWPSSAPAWEMAWGKFSGYFTKIGTSCPSGQALQGFTSAFDKNCVTVWTSTAVNGACWSANGASVTSAPTSGLCSAGTASIVTWSGPWSWTCASTSGWTTATCGASVASATVTYAWSSGAWGSCTLFTSPERYTKSRTVQCKSSVGSVVADSYCTATKPSSQTACCWWGTGDVFLIGCSHVWPETTPGNTITAPTITAWKTGTVTGYCTTYPWNSNYGQWSKFYGTCMSSTNIPASSGGAGGPIYLAYGLNGTYILWTPNYSFTTPFSGGCGIASWPACPYWALCWTGNRSTNGNLKWVVTWQLNSVGTVTWGWGKCLSE